MTFRYSGLRGLTHNYSGIPTIWAYKSEEDTISEMLASGYFNDPLVDMNEGDILHATGTDGSETLKVSGSNEVSIQSSSTTGWADYTDTQYTSGAPLSVSADTDTVLTNNGLGGPKTQSPSGVTFYSDGVITGRNGDGLMITLEMTVERQSGTGEFDFETWFDIGGAVGELYRRYYRLRGAGEARKIISTTNVYTLDTWEANGATVYIRSQVAVDVYDIRFLISRVHKAK